jgi:RNA polymerase sigma-70 factor (ECF subfamily)
LERLLCLAGVEKHDKLRRLKRTSLATHQELSRFLAQIERRAFKHAYFSVQDEAIALDIVQDAMLKLAEKYADKPAGELPLLFQRILQNAITDHHRRNKVRSFWVTSFSSLFGSREEEESDPLEALEIADNASTTEPSQQLERSQVVAIIEGGLKKLPARQRQAFLLRYWEEMDVSETARVMGCSEGSVKTHCSRATHTLAALLKKHGVKL